MHRHGGRTVKQMATIVIVLILAAITAIAIGEWAFDGSLDTRLMSGGGAAQFWGLVMVASPEIPHSLSPLRRSVWRAARQAASASHRIWSSAKSTADALHALARRGRRQSLRASFGGQVSMHANLTVQHERGGTTSEQLERLWDDYDALKVGLASEKRDRIATEASLRREIDRARRSAVSEVAQHLLLVRVVGIALVAVGVGLNTLGPSV